jgi:hypothetical protein
MGTTVPDDILGAAIYGMRIGEQQEYSRKAIS